MNDGCRHVRELLDSFLSGELTVETNHTVLRHLESCQACRSEAERRRTTRKLLAEVVRGDVSDVDVAKLRARITGTIDADHHGWSRVLKYWPIAAVLALAAAVADRKSVV